MKSGWDNEVKKSNNNQYGARRRTGFFMLIAIVLLSGIGIVAGFLLSNRQVIELSFDQQSCYIDTPRFDLKWLHSVEKQWWIESYQIEGDHLLLTDAYLQTFGAGTPATESVATNSRAEYQGYIRYQIHTRLPYLNWMISSNIQALIIPKILTSNIESAYPQSLHFEQGRPLPVYQWVSDYTNIYIAPMRQSRWSLWFKEPCYDYQH